MCSDCPVEDVLLTSAWESPVCPEARKAEVSWPLSATYSGWSCLLAALWMKLKLRRADCKGQEEPALLVVAVS